MTSRPCAQARGLWSTQGAIRGLVRSTRAVWWGMDTVYRLVRFALLLACIALLGAGPRAFAAGTVPSGAATSCYGWFVSPYEQSGLSFFSCSAAGAVQKFADYWEVNHAVCSPGSTYYSIQAGTYVGTAGNESAFYYTGGACSSAPPTRGGTNGNYRSFTRTTATPLTGSCPANSTAVGASCACAAGFVPAPVGNAVTNTVCAAAATQCASVAAGITDPDYIFTFTGSADTKFCDGTTFCQLQGKLAVGVQGKVAVSGPFTSTGSDCTGGASTPAVAPTCPTGQVLGTVNGSSVCVPGTSSATAGSAASSAPAGAASAPGRTVSDGAGGSINIPAGGSSSSETKCVGAQCTITTTVKDASGSTVGQFTTSQSQEKFCVENPETTICKASSATVSCAAGVATMACDGDAIQCAILRDQYARHCALFDATGAVRDTGQAALDRGDTRASDHPGAPGNITSTAVGSAQDTTDLLPGSCPADVTVAVGSGSVVMPWSKVCTPATWLGNLLVGLTSLAWVFIAFKQG